MMKNVLPCSLPKMLVVLAACAGLGGAMPRAALAVPVVGYSLQILEGTTGGGGGPLMASAQLMAAQDTPLFMLSNTSTEALITSFSITIGNLSYNFDAVTFNPNQGNTKVTSVTPDQAQGGARSDLLTLTFSNFAASTAFSFRADIDRDSDNGLSLTNFRTVLTGATPATVTVAFSDGSSLTNTLASTGSGDPLYSIYRCAALVSIPSVAQQGMAPAQPIPEPSSLALAGLAATGLALAGGWRRWHGSRMRAS
ncbi:MAG: hypothetical protein JNG90_17090 [Planctomycetaceae bacterium]|nr:hypothetical protein [Planctomycetaceae bacterium]